MREVIIFEGASLHIVDNLCTVAGIHPESGDTFNICKMSLQISDGEYDRLGRDSFFYGTKKESGTENCYSKEFVIKDRFLDYVLRGMNTKHITNEVYQGAVEDCAILSSKVINLEAKLRSIESANIFQRIFKRW